jgi:hypothetical protein
VSTPREAPDGPRTRRQAATPSAPQPRSGEKDLDEMKDPYDLPFADYSDHRPPRHPEYVIVVDQLRGWQPGGPPSLAELLETGRAREPEPDLEAEP